MNVLENMVKNPLAAPKQQVGNQCVMTLDFQLLFYNIVILLAEITVLRQKRHKILKTPKLMEHAA